MPEQELTIREWLKKGAAPICSRCGHTVAGCGDDAVSCVCYRCVNYLSSPERIGNG